MDWNDLHTTVSNLLSITLIGVLGSTLTVQWWSCGNGPVEVNRIWSYGSVMAVTGLCVAIAARHYKLHPQLKYWSEVVLRFLLVYAIFTTALLKAEGHFYNYSLFNGETKLANLEADTFANAFYGFSPMFQAYIGYIILGGLALICFKQTQRLGNVLLVVIMTNAVMLNYSFNSCFILKNSIYLAVIIYFIFADLPAFFAFFTRQKTTFKSEYHPFRGHPHLIHTNSLFKIILLVGFFFYNHDYIEDVKNYRSRNVNSPVTGVWKIMDIEFLKKETPEENKKDIQKFKSIILDKGRFGAVEIEDSLSFFEYIIDPNYNQLEFWNFQDFWEMNIKGRYRKITEDSMVYIGRNRKDSLRIMLKKQAP
ncbi:MAG: hypothetical protein AAGA77_08625 [Bacteroidota bacterium]